MNISITPTSATSSGTLSAPATDACLVPTDRTQITRRFTEDGVYNREAPYFSKRFGYDIDDIPVIPNRYRIIGSVTCGWNRRQRIVLRLLGLQDVVNVESLPGGRDAKGWVLDPNGLGAIFGHTHLADFYAATDPDFIGRATSPTVIDEKTGKVVTNNYHTLTLDWETVWRPYWKPGAPDLYPKDLRPRIDLLNQQLFDDINNGTYKAIFPADKRTALIQLHVFKARLEDLDFRLESRRYLFGERLTDSDVRLFQTLEAYETMYRPGIVRRQESEDGVPHVWDYPTLWAYARDLFQTPGFIDDEELREFGFIPDDNGQYSSRLDAQEKQDMLAAGYFGGAPTVDRAERYQAWLEPANREGLSGDVNYSGPGTAGLEKLWRLA